LILLILKVPLKVFQILIIIIDFLKYYLHSLFPLTHSLPKPTNFISFPPLDLLTKRMYFLVYVRSIHQTLKPFLLTTQNCFLLLLHLDHHLALSILIFIIIKTFIYPLLYYDGDLAERNGQDNLLELLSLIFQ